MRYRLTSDAGSARPRARRPRSLHHHLDHHSLDPARVHGRRLPSRLRIRGARGQRRPQIAELADGSGLHRRRRTRALPSSPPASSAQPRNSPASKAAQLEHTTFKHPFLERSILGVLATYVTADPGTGAVHTAPSHGADDFYTGQRYDLDQTCRVDAAGHLHVDPGCVASRLPPSLRRQESLGRQSHHRRHARGVRALCSPSPISSTPTRTAGAATIPSSSAPPSSGSSRSKRPMKRADGSETTYRQLVHRRNRQGRLGSVVGQGAHHQHDRHAPRLVHQPPAHLGRAHRRLHVRRLQPAHHRSGARIAKSSISSNAKAPKPGTPRRSPICFPQDTKCAHCEGATFRKETDILDVWFDSGTSWFAVCESDPDLHTAYKAFQKGEGREARSASTSKAAISTAAGSTPRCSPPSLSAAARPTRTSPPPAGRSTSKAAPCPNRSATASIPSTSPTAWAAKSSASGSPPSTSAKTWPPAKT